MPYRGGGKSLADFLAGVVQIHADPNTMPHVSAGKAKLFAVLDRRRQADFPNVPLLKEIYPELDFRYGSRCSRRPAHRSRSSAR